MAWFEQHPEEEVPAEIKAQIAELFKANVEDMDATALRAVLANIKSLRSSGYLRHKSQQIQKRIDLNERAADVASDVNLARKRDPETPLEKALERTNKEKRGGPGRHLKGFLWSHWRPEHITEWFDGYKGGLHKEVFMTALGAEEDKLRNLEQTLRDLDKIFEGLKVGQALNRNHVVAKVNMEEGGTLPLTIDNLMFIYANSQNDSNKAHLRGTGISDSEIERLSAILHKEFPEFANAVDRLIDWMDDVQFARLNQVFAAMNNVDMLKEDRYFPIRHLDTALAENAIMADMIARHSTKAGVAKGQTISRIKSRAPFTSMGFFDTVMDHIFQTEHYLAYSEAVQQINTFLRHRDVKTALKSRNSEAYQQLIDWLKAVSYGRIQGSEQPLDRISDFLRTNFVTAALGLNLVTMLKQPASFAQGARSINPLNLTGASMSFMANPREMFRFVQSRSVMMKNRAAAVEREIAEILEKGAVRRALGGPDHQAACP